MQKLVTVVMKGKRVREPNRVGARASSAVMIGVEALR